MPRKNFSAVGCDLMEIVREEKKIKDVELMVKLEFNPETWRIWKAKLVEWFEDRTYQKKDVDDENDRE